MQTLRYCTLYTVYMLDIINYRHFGYCRYSRYCRYLDLLGVVVEALAHGPLSMQVLELGADLAVLLNLTLNLMQKYLLIIKKNCLRKKYLLKVKIFVTSFTFLCVCVCLRLWCGEVEG